MGVAADADAGAGADTGVDIGVVAAAGGGERGERGELLKLADGGGSSICWGIDIVWRAIIVAEGGVFSPRNGRWVGLRAGVSLISNRGAGEGVTCRVGLGSASLPK